MSAQLNVMNRSLSYFRQLTLGNINPYVMQVEDLTLTLLTKASEIKKELQQGVKKPFTKVVECHWGDAQALGQKPITFLRQVMAVCTFPELQHDASIPEDAKHRAKKILESCDGGSIGAYNHSQSLTYIQRKLAKYIERRDGGVASHPHHIYIMNGTSTCITIMMNMLITGEGACRTGLLTPSPQFPSFASIISLLDGVHVKYLLNEERGWTLEIPELQRALTQARTHCNPLVLSVINPHNPTGHVMTRKTIEDVIKFAAKEKLFLLVDEVWCVVCDTDGVCYRCGIRSSFMEVVNLDSEVQTVLDCISSISDCSIYAQIVIDVFADPPQPGDPSYQLFIMEKEAIRRRQADHALLIETILNSEVGIYCCPIQGGVFAYPRIHIPPKALEAAQVLNQEADVFYCTRLLEETGILVLAGSYLSQRPGTHYIRLTLLLETEMLRKILRTITQFHRRFTSAFS
eukprot:gi/632955149/ref/XP_007893327.1/ PREDICTED: alanine aminotransferase 2-like [Callorhinchus milii]